MERERWLLMYRAALRLDKTSCRGLFSAAAILGVFFWAVLHGRPVCWACRADNWPLGLWRYALPSQSTMSRRLRDPQVRRLLTLVEESWEDDGAAEVKTIDAKPLPVGGHSKDRDVAFGHGMKTMLKGYKFYAIWAPGGLRPIAWRIASMRVSEQAMALEMIPQLTGGGHLLGDSLYDINKIYDAAGAVGHQLLAPRKCPEAGFAKYPQSAYRLRGLAQLGTPAGRELHERRDAIERQFGSLTAFGGGLGPLPAWVRRKQRVHLWVQTKLIINAHRIQKLRQNNPQAVA